MSYYARALTAEEAIRNAVADALSRNGVLHPLTADTAKRFGVSTDPAAYAPTLRPVGEPEDDRTVIDDELYARHEQVQGRAFAAALYRRKSEAPRAATRFQGQAALGEPQRGTRAHAAWTAKGIFAKAGILGRNAFEPADSALDSEKLKAWEAQAREQRERQIREQRRAEEATSLAQYHPGETGIRAWRSPELNRAIDGITSHIDGVLQYGPAWANRSK